MLKEAYHPNAYLTSIRNVKLGLKARTKILKVLESRSLETKNIAGEAGLHYHVVRYHLKLLEKEGIVQRKGSRPYVWGLTGLGQKRLVDLR
ncbi:ArsR family transcriptional regulator [Candidatus Bathyarchaeota archaeon]|nr:MAG: ArsR family transcriptional regulator [Candidatus Bathyarchaeota archaeon]RLI17244.1 MAG: hypothetical protein DRO44_03990 [Candidatus Bathyarchaeota archaeon]